MKVFYTEKEQESGRHDIEAQIVPFFGSKKRYTIRMLTRHKVKLTKSEAYDIAKAILKKKRYWMNVENPKQDFKFSTTLKNHKATFLIKLEK